MPIIAEHGLTEFALDEVSDRAGVTRNLLYHYFPRGRADLVRVAVEDAGRQLTEDWVLDDALPLEDRLAANFSRIAEHATRPSDAWRIHRYARAAREPELREIVSQFVELVISSISLNHLGTAQPPPLVHLALRGYLALAESILDEAPTSGADHDEVMQILTGTLVSTIGAAVSAGR